MYQDWSYTWTNRNQCCECMERRDIPSFYHFTHDREMFSCLLCCCTSFPTDSDVRFCNQRLFLCNQSGWKVDASQVVRQLGAYFEPIWTKPAGRLRSLDPGASTTGAATDRVMPTGRPGCRTNPSANKPWFEPAWHWPVHASLVRTGQVEDPTGLGLWWPERTVVLGILESQGQAGTNKKLHIPVQQRSFWTEFQPNWWNFVFSDAETFVPNYW